MSKKPEVITMGDPVMDYIHIGTDPYTLENKFLSIPGGTASNLAVGVARQGLRVGVIVSLGCDKDGEAIFSLFGQNGVDRQYISQKSSTTSAVIYPSTNGRKNHTLNRSLDSGQFPNPDFVQPEYFSGVDILYLSSISLLGEGPYQASLKAIEITRDYGGVVAFGVNPRLNVWPSAELARDRISEGFERSDLIFASDEDLFLVFGETGYRHKAADIMSSSKAALIVVTCGEEGVYYKTSSGVENQIPAFKVNVMESTGAGDAFAAVVVAETSLLRRRKAINEFSEDEWREMMVRGSAAGAIVVTTLQVTEAMPNRGEIDNFLLTHTLVK